MKTIEEAREKLLVELRADEDGDIRKEYWTRYEQGINEFVDHMAAAYVDLNVVEGQIKGDEGRGLVAALIYTALMLNLLSMKLFLSGHIVAAGALFRQVLEAISLALLCSKKDLGVRSRFQNDRYSTNDAITHLVRRCEQLNLKPEAVRRVQESQKFYHKYSHVGRFTIASAMVFEGPGLYIGAAFDKGKFESYDKEFQGRKSLAAILPNFIAAVSQHLADETP